MAIYLLMFVYISFLAFFSLKYEDKEQELRFLVLPTFFFFLIIAGFRTSSVGGDLGTYIHIFESNNLQLPDLSQLFRSRFEIGYLVINIFLRNFSDHYTFLLFSYAFITLFAWFFVLYKHSKNVYMSLLIYFSSLGLFFYSLSNIRQGLAIALSFLGFHYLVKNKKVLASIFILLTPLFHTSGIVCFLFFPLKKIVLNKRTYQFVFILFLIIFPFIKQIATTFISFFPQYTSYLESSWFLESNKWSITVTTDTLRLTSKSFNELKEVLSEKMKIQKSISKRTENKQAEIIAALSAIYTKTDCSKPYETAETIIQEWERQADKLGKPPTGDTLAKYIKQGIDRLSQ